MSPFRASCDDNCRVLPKCSGPSLVLNVQLLIVMLIIPTVSVCSANYSALKWQKKNITVTFQSNISVCTQRTIRDLYNLYKQSRSARWLEGDDWVEIHSVCRRPAVPVCWSLHESADYNPKPEVLWGGSQFILQPNHTPHFTRCGWLVVPVGYPFLSWWSQPTPDVD